MSESTTGRVLISGAGVAGPALAYWLDRFGFEPTVVEVAPALREGGQAVDFRGEAHLRLLGRMGILDEIRAQQVHMGATSFVDARGDRQAGLDDEFASGDVEIMRGDLTRILHRATADRAEYVFGDSVTSIEEDAAGVAVTFRNAAPARYDLVVGADGLHSNVRRLVFGEESRFVEHMGYYVASFSADDRPLPARTGWIQCVPGRAAGLSSSERSTRGTVYFASPALDYDRHDAAAQKRIVADHMKGVEGQVPRVLDSMWRAPDLYLDSISQVHMEEWSKGRVTLLGDAGYGGTIGGMGTGVALVAAYVLAGELAASPRDHVAAFRRYSDRVRDFALRCQKGAASVGPFMAPRSRLGIWARNQTLRAMYLMPGKGLMERMAAGRASGIDLPDYPSSDAMPVPVVPGTLPT
ncbi:MAG TPA: FAD-dependent monooxygenase [Candidatus Dormibacteraeota bacterium]|jgi:2-polyprenyl-6-methoxyphenol hydroxylase-like FAD-dependent oxidoreductase|nr:FAD-dependent monooxygenase [Candidatus Dormibacteraeota bacterium]